ncbi:MAG: XRE family transcriptional regulator [Candidatus Tokpelaia sp.]|uniref:helix-turn-helix domain-containing protein n=1 Tax=Candidatus Tokpelaia sp. TaxID=2233777 RepID=UPI00123B2C71|nr:helix-turn-helix transcriptional regulator [Candidatus Tokpelaia sp.]KAA6205649.1 MAG: XRE family transcriptional regulator [Candidatus Tokpelaia sp.]KAA6207264.1 MAG: XRE family transcriptional regulator [Candidatus Tokpelaia sp.]KAA6405213.1 XRE family transcriptional regulator [Candidatus Tokpelaia sp.]
MDKEKFKLWRKKMGFSQIEAAKALGISRLSVQNYERGMRLEDGRPVRIPHPVALACAAIAAGLKPYGD